MRLIFFGNGGTDVPTTTPIKVNRNSFVLRNCHEYSNAKSESSCYEEGVDYVTVTVKKVTDEINKLETTLIEYHISLEMGKHIAMMERNVRCLPVRLLN